MLNTYFYYQLPPIRFGVGYTIFRETTALAAQKCWKKHIVFQQLTQFNTLCAFGSHK